jgi:hypothetical protein
MSVDESDYHTMPISFYRDEPYEINVGPWSLTLKRDRR